MRLRKAPDLNAESSLQFSKCLNYIELQRTSEVSFVIFLVVWT